MLRPRSATAARHVAIIGRTIRDLWGEYDDALARAQRSEVKAWRDRWWPRHAALQGLGGAVSRITPASDGTYTPDPDGPLPAILCPAWRDVAPGLREDLVDLVAWTPTTGAMFSRLGLADVLGAAAIDRAMPCMGSVDPLVIYADPGEWAHAHTWDHRGDHGVVIIRWDRVRSVLGHLVGVTDFAAPDIATGRRLRSALTAPPPPSPRILVPTTGVAAA
jgi:hypothetical protein